MSPVHSKPVVHSPRDCFQWNRHYLSTDDMRAAESHIEHCLTHLSLTTAFSGVCSPSIATHCLVAGFGAEAASRMKLQYYNSVEWSNECNFELSSLPTPPCCQHSDITAFLTADTRELIAELGEDPPREKLEWIILERPGALTTSAPCRNHPDRTCHFRHSFLHVAGPPCVDWSINGLCQGLSGPTTVHLLTWIALVRLVRPSVVICENVVRWPHTYVAKWLDGYTMSSTVVNNTAFGIPVERSRRYTVFVLDGTHTLARALSGRFGVEATLGRDIGPTHSYLEYLIARPGELDAELMWASTRDAAPALGPLKSTDRNAFERALVPFEHQHLAGFRKCQRGVAYTLSVNPEDRISKGKSSILHTLTAGQHLVWVDGNNVDRWISARELLSYQGIPTYDEWLDAICPGAPVACCSFNFSRMRLGLPPRNRRHMTIQSGNGMHVAVVGSIILWCIRFVSATPNVNVPSPLTCRNVDSPDTDTQCDDDVRSFKSFDNIFSVSVKRKPTHALQDIDSSSISSVVSCVSRITGAPSVLCARESPTLLTARFVASESEAPSSTDTTATSTTFDSMFARSSRKRLRK